VTYGSNGNFTQGPVQGLFNNRTTSNFVARARAYITADAREQTAFGTVRAYVAVGLATTDTGNTILPSALGLNRAFIQWAGITAGITQSFYDFYSSPAMGYRAFNPASDTGDPGWWVWGYTAQLGNGISATIAAEQRRSSQICDFSEGATAPISGGAGAGACNTAGDLASSTGLPAPFFTVTPNGNSNPLGYGGMQTPDIVGNIRLDQTWGSAQVMAAGHLVNAPYYLSTPISGTPGDDWGWAVGAGLRLNFPMIAQGDYFQSQVNYAEGASRYVNFNGSVPTLLNSGSFGSNTNSLAYGLISDCIYGSSGTHLGVALNTTGCNLTTSWGVNAGYEHYWTPQFHESFFGSWYEVRYNDQANNILCDAEFPTATGVGGGAHGALSIGVAGCNNKRLADRNRRHAPPV
jgi:Porin subfamily